MLHLLRARSKTWHHASDLPVKDTYPEVNCEHTPEKLILRPIISKVLEVKERPAGCRLEETK